MVNDILAIRAAGERVAALMRDAEAELVHELETTLFPTGAPASVSIASLMRAMVGLLSSSADRMAEADIAYSRELRKQEPGRHTGSLISSEVAYRLAQTAQLEELVNESAERAGAAVERRLFPQGRPSDLSMLGLLESFRCHLEDAVAQVDASEQTDGAATLQKTMSSLAGIYIGWCDLIGKTDIANDIHACVEQFPED